MKGTSPDQMTIGEAARALERCTETVREYERRGRLPATRIGGFRIFRREDVERLAAELSASGTHGDEAA